MSTAAANIGSYISGLAFEHLPDDVRQYSLALLLNQLGLSLAAQDSKIASTYRRAATHSPPAAAGALATALCGQILLDAQDAAFANAALFHTRVQDDTYGTAHLGAPVIAAALAVAESEGADGSTALASIVAGYEVGAVLVDALGDSLPPRAFRTTGVIGTIAATAAAARALRLAPGEVAHALSIATSLAAGLTEPFGAGTSDYVLQSAAAAHNGVRAARLAKMGITGSPAAFESSSGFCAAFSGDSLPAERLVHGLGHRHRILSVMVKALPICAGNHTPVFNAQQIRSRMGEGDSVRRVEIQMNPLEASYPGISSDGPFLTRIDTLMSAKFTTSLALLGRQISPADLDDLDNTEVMNLVQRTAIKESSALDIYESRLRIETENGMKFDETFKLSPSSWHPNLAAVRDRLMQLPELGHMSHQLNKTALAVLRLEEMSNVKDLVQLASVPTKTTDT